MTRSESRRYAAALIPAGDRDKLVTAIKQMRDGGRPDLVERLHERVARYFSVDAMTESVLAAYDEAIALQSQLIDQGRTEFTRDLAASRHARGGGTVNEHRLRLFGRRRTDSELMDPFSASASRSASVGRLLLLSTAALITETEEANCGGSTISSPNCRAVASHSFARTKALGQ